MKKRLYLISIFVVLVICAFAQKQVQQYEYWFDDNYIAKTTNSITPTTVYQLNKTISTIGLSEGLHCFQIRFKDSEDKWSSTSVQFFIKQPLITDDKNKIARYEYWFDNNYTAKTVQSVDNQSDLSLVSSIETDNLNEGLHTFQLRFQSVKGQWSSTSTQFFVKPNLSSFRKNKIVSYEYWCNQSENSKRRVDISPANPLELKNKLIEVTDLKQTVTPDSFSFVPDVHGNAKIYYLASNHLQIRFLDENGLWSSPSISSFADGKGIDIFADTLYSKVPVTKAKPASDEIHFYKLNALSGDSLIWKTTQPCTLQVFDPFGVEVYKATGNNVLSFNGVRARRDGVYHVLLHTQTTNSPQITLNYEHIHKYEILGHTPKMTGNKGNVWIKVDGNGFTPTTKISLKLDDIIISCDSSIYNGLSVISAMFLTDDLSPEMKYDLSVDYGDTVIVVKNAISVEKAITGNLNIEINGQTTVLSNSTNIYKIRVTNTGNTTIEYPFITVELICDEINTTILTKSNSDNLNLLRLIGNETPDYTFLDDGNNSHIKQCVFTIPFLQPYQSKDFEIFVKSRGDFQVSVWQNDYYSKEFLNKMLTYSMMTVNQNISVSRIKGTNNCIDNLLDNFKETLKPSNDKLNEIAEYLNSMKKKIGQFELEFSPFMNTSIPDNIYAVGTSLAPKKKIKNIIEAYNKQSIYFTTPLELIIRSNVSAGKSSIKQNTQSRKLIVQNLCDKPPIPPSFKVKIVNSFDPNNKIGYRSLSGSKYFNTHLSNINYVINFENDYKKATVAAHDVYLIDTLDITKFDISSFSANHIQIGNKIVHAPYNIQNYLWNIDMRPEKNLITRVKLTLDDIKGIVRWHFSSIDPITDQPTTDVFAGFLPPNDSVGSGQGSVSFTINLKDTIQNGSSVNNRASIVFDYNDAILTPIWSNTKDVITPVSIMSQPEIISDSIASLSWIGEDNENGSGVYRYNVYAKKGTEAYSTLLSSTALNSISFKFDKNVDYAFYVTAIDSAGNAEIKTNVPDVTMKVTAIQSVLSTQRSMKVFPNPSINGQGVYVTFDIPNEKLNHARLVISSLLGSLVKEIDLTGNKIHIEDISNGMYIFNLQIDGISVEHKKVIIQ